MKEEIYHAITDNKLWRESYYFNFIDPITHIAGFLTIAFRPNQKYKEVVVVLYPDVDTILVYRCKEKCTKYPDTLRVGNLVMESCDENNWRFYFKGNISTFKKETFPPNPLMLAFAKKESVSFDISFSGTSTSVNFKDTVIAEDVDLQKIFETQMSADHIEQSGIFLGTLNYHAVSQHINGVGERDHAWGIRDWSYLDSLNLFTMFFSHNFSIHGMVVRKDGKEVYAGFVYKNKKTWPIKKISVATEFSDAGEQKKFDIVVTYHNQTLKINGRALHVAKIPLVVNTNILTFFSKPYTLLLYEGHAEYTYKNMTGYGLAEYLDKNKI